MEGTASNTSGIKAASKPTPMMMAKSISRPRWEGPGMALPTMDRRAPPRPVCPLSRPSGRAIGGGDQERLRRVAQVLEDAVGDATRSVPVGGCRQIREHIARRRAGCRHHVDLSAQRRQDRPHKQQEPVEDEGPHGHQHDARDDLGQEVRVLAGDEELPEAADSDQ